MRTHVISLFSLFLFIMVAGQAVAQDDARFDLTGEWTYTTSGAWVKGACPPGGPKKGTCVIEQDGTRFTMVIKTGARCSPEAMCIYKGTVSGTKYAGSNSAQVDNEGGVAENKITFSAVSDIKAAGTSSSSYKHPSGFTCGWGADMVLTRK